MIISFFFLGRSCGVWEAAVSKSSRMFPHCLWPERGMLWGLQRYAVFFIALQNTSQWTRFFMNLAFSFSIFCQWCVTASDKYWQKSSFTGGVLVNNNHYKNFLLTKMRVDLSSDKRDILTTPYLHHAFNAWKSIFGFLWFEWTLKNFSLFFLWLFLQNLFAYYKSSILK